MGFARWLERRAKPGFSGLTALSVTGLLVSAGFRPGMIASRASFLRVDTFVISYP